jgi:hypothetical protein
MNAIIAAGRRRGRLVGVALAALIAPGILAFPDVATAAGFATIEPETGTAAAMPGMPPAPLIPRLPPPAATAPLPPAQSANTAPPQTTGGLPASDAINIVNWGIGPRLGSVAGEVTAGQPLYLWMTIEGGKAAVDRLSAAGPIAVDVRWSHAAADATSGAPDLTTRLTIGRPGFAAILAGEVARQGHFEWHSWARKDSLSPGRWTVSLSDRDGRPLMCGRSAPQPCRFSVTIG